MTKSDLIERLAAGQIHLPPRDIETSVNAVLEHMSNSLVEGDRIEIRGFGSIGLRYRAPRIGRNPKTGESVSVPGKYHHVVIPLDAVPEDIVDAHAARGLLLGARWLT